MAIKLGIAPIGWSNDDLPELGGDIPLEQCLREAREAGFSGVEKGGKFPLDAKVLKPLLDDNHLALASGWFSGGLLELTVEAEMKRLGEQLDLFLALGAPVMVYAETTRTVQNRRAVPVADRPVLRQDDIRRYGEKLSKLADWLAAQGCPLTYHHHMGTVIETEREIDTLMANSDTSVSLLLDTGHLTFARGDVEATTRRWAARINHVHVKNIREPLLERVREERLSFLDGVVLGVFTVPGDPEGCIDFRAFTKVLADIGYAGWVVVEAEQDPAKADPLEQACMGYEEMVAAAAAAGLAISR